MCRTRLTFSTHCFIVATPPEEGSSYLHLIGNCMSMGLNTVQNNLMMAAFIIQEITKTKSCLCPHEWLLICNMIQWEIFVVKRNALSRTATCQEGLYVHYTNICHLKCSTSLSLTVLTKFSRTVLARSCFVGGDKLALWRAISTPAN